MNADKPNLTLQTVVLDPCPSVLFVVVPDRYVDRRAAVSFQLAWRERDLETAAAYEPD